MDPTKTEPKELFEMDSKVYKDLVYGLIPYLDLS